MTPSPHVVLRKSPPKLFGQVGCKTGISAPADVNGLGRNVWDFARIKTEYELAPCESGTEYDVAEVLGESSEFAGLPRCPSVLADNLDTNHNAI